MLAILPTGFGKSLIFQSLALTKKETVVLVIYPLASIGELAPSTIPSMNEQLSLAAPRSVSVNRHI